jgi:hypothetical protein
MTVLINDEEAGRLIRQLAERTGKTLTSAVKGAAAEKLARTPLSEAEIADRRAKLDAYLAKFDAMSTIDPRTRSSATMTRATSTDGH